MNKPEPGMVSSFDRQQTEELPAQKVKNDRIDSFISYELPPGVIEATNGSFTDSKNSSDNGSPNDSPIKRLITLKANNKVEQTYANQANLKPIHEHDEGHNPSPLDMNLVIQNNGE